jgi:excisionase family DNA binding protein
VTRRSTSAQSLSLDSFPDLLTIAELQEVLRVQRTTAYGLIREKAIPVVRVGRLVRVRKADVASFIEKRRVA